MTLLFWPFALFASPLSAAEPEGKHVPAPIVYFDIAGPAGARQAAFYEQVFGWTAGPGGVVSVPVNGPLLAGSLRTDPAAKVIYLGVADIESTQKDITAHGGKIVVPRFEVKGVAILSLFTDPAGNSMGLVELAPDGKTRIP